MTLSEMVIRCIITENILITVTDSIKRTSTIVTLTEQDGVKVRQEGQLINKIILQDY